MTPNISEEVREYFKNLAPLTPITSKDVYKSLAAKIPNLKYHTLREAIQRLSLGSPTSERRKTKQFFAVYIEIPELRMATGKSDIYLSFPGIEREYVERMASDETKCIQEEFNKQYGKETISFWVKRSQLNVGVSETVKKEVKGRDKNKCRLCEAIEQIFINERKSPPIHLHSQKPTVCHIISRSSIFWHILKSVNEKHHTIFYDIAVKELKEKVKQNHLFSQSEFLAFLCKTHDQIVQNAVERKITLGTTI